LHFIHYAGSVPRGLASLSIFLTALSLYAQEPIHVAFDCTEQDTREAGLTCSEDEPCPVYLELSGVESFLNRVFIVGNLHTSEATLFSILLASDDSGKTWRFVSFIPLGDSAHYAPSTHLCGDLNHIYTQTSAGVLLSTDQGITWQNLCGPKFPIWEEGQVYGGFYQSSHYIYCSDGEEINDSAHLWYLNLDSLIDIFPTSFTFPDSVKQKTVTAGNKVTVNFSPQTADPIGIDSGHIVIHFDSTSLTLDSLALPPSWVIVDSSSGPGYVNLQITADSNQQLPNPIITLAFTTYLGTSLAGTKVYLDSAHLYGKRLNCDCQALSTDVDSVEIDFTGCGDSTILAVMHHEPVFSIESIVPNPAQDEIRVSGTGLRVPGMDVELYNALGQLIGIPPPSSLSLHPSSLSVDVSNVPSGIYYLRFSSGGYVQTRSISVAR